MRWSFPVARLFGIELRIHVTFLLLLLWIGGAHGLEGGWSAATAGVVFVLMVFGCVVLHELGHAMAGRKFGIRTEDITLLPIGGVAHLERIPENPREEIIVALAGPLVSAGLALVFWIAAGFSGPTLEAETLGLDDLAARLFSINLGLLLFNLIPAFPMDGGRVLRALLAFRMGGRRATRIAAGIGQTLAFALGAASWILSAPVLLLIAIFIYFGAASEAAYAELRSACRGLRVADAMITSFATLPGDARLRDAAALLQHTAQHDFPFVNNAGQFLGLLTRTALIMGLQEVGPDGAALPYAQKDLPSVLSTHLFSHAFAVMQQHESPTLPVLDENNRLWGLFSQEKVGELLLLQSTKNVRA